MDGSVGECAEQVISEREWVMAKEKTKGEELGAIGKQIMAHAYSAMDYYLDRHVGTLRRNRIRRESESLCPEERCRYTRIRSGPELRQGYPKYGTNSDGIHARSVGSVWR